MERFGYCRLCGEFKKLTFEHIPPEAAFNSNPIYFKDFENLFDKSSYHYGLRKRSNKGAGGYHLCEKCNNDTGGWYAKHYVELA